MGVADLKVFTEEKKFNEIMEKEEHPFDQYLAGLDFHRDKNQQKAGEKIAQALGSEKSTYFIDASLDRIFDRKTVLHSSVLTAITSEVRRQKHVGRKNPLSKHN